MIEGRFGNDGACYIQTRLIFIEHDIDTEVTFLIDTGADVSTLMPVDVARIELDTSGLRRGTLAVGVGGVIATRETTAALVFSDATALYTFVVDLSVVPSPPGYDLAADSERIPSLLGRDVLDHGCLTVCPPHGLVTFEVLEPDFVEPIAPAG